MITALLASAAIAKKGGFSMAPRKSFVTLFVGCVLLAAPPSFAATLIDQVTVGYSSFSGAYVPLWARSKSSWGGSMVLK